MLNFLPFNNVVCIELSTYDNMICSIIPNQMPASILISISPTTFFNHNPKSPKSRKPSPPILISANPSLLNPIHLQTLFTTSDFSCHRFPILTPTNKPEPVNIDKLSLAIKHSYIVVSVFCKKNYLSSNGRDDSFMGFLGLMGDQDLQLVGFGRAVSDGGLTASIHDVMVIPQLRGMGIGRKIVQRITRLLSSRGIYDISALCSEKERLFFEACGFGDDSLGSTTMVYTRSAKNICEDNTTFRRAGKLLLLIPPCKPVLAKKIFVKVHDSVSTST